MRCQEGVRTGISEAVRMGSRISRHSTAGELRERNVNTISVAFCAIVIIISRHLLTNHCDSLLWDCWFGCLKWPIVWWMGW